MVIYHFYWLQKGATTHITMFGIEEIKAWALGEDERGVEIHES